jgi:hypothetical protein
VQHARQDVHPILVLTSGRRFGYWLPIFKEGSWYGEYYEGQVTSH